jgi:hypothetical protein
MIFHPVCELVLIVVVPSRGASSLTFEVEIDESGEIIWWRELLVVPGAGQTESEASSTERDDADADVGGVDGEAVIARPRALVARLRWRKSCMLMRNLGVVTTVMRRSAIIGKKWENCRNHVRPFEWIFVWIFCSGGNMLNCGK